MEIDLQFVRDRVAIGNVRVLHVPTTSQFADIFTKVKKLLDLLGVSIQPQRSRRWLVVAGGVFAPCTLFILSSCPVLNTAVPVVQTAGGVGFLVVQS